MLNDIPLHAYQFAGVGNAPKDIGPCETWNCGRGAWRTQMNLRVSYSIRLVGRARVEAIGEIFNLFNAKNPSGFITRRLLGTGAAEPDFMQPSERTGRLPEPGAAGRPDRVPLLVLKRLA